MIKEIPKADIITRPIKVYKEWTLDENDINPIFGIDGSNTLIDVDVDETSHGFVKKIVHASIKSQFYRNSATASILTEVGKRKSYASTNERILENELAVFSIPQLYYGEGVKVGTVVLEDEQLGRIYTDDGYSNLIDSGSNIKGNIFYDRGLIVVSKDVVSGSVLSQFNLNFRSTKTIYENEVFLPVLENEFNYSQNPSAVDMNGGSVYEHTITNPNDPNGGNASGSIKIYNHGVKLVKGTNRPYISTIDPTKFGSFDDFLVSGSVDPTGSFLAPCITTIALYDNELNMVAVAKLPKPIKSLPDYPVNFIVRFDT
jgi:hypothetical protein